MNSIIIIAVCVCWPLREEYYLGPSVFAYCANFGILSWQAEKIVFEAYFFSIYQWQEYAVEDMLVIWLE